MYWMNPFNKPLCSYVLTASHMFLKSWLMFKRSPLAFGECLFTGMWKPVQVVTNVLGGLDIALVFPRTFVDENVESTISILRSVRDCIQNSCVCMSGGGGLWFSYCRNASLFPLFLLYSFFL